MNTSQTVLKESNTATAVSKLRGMIFSGKLGAGTDHLESELAAQLGMSRTPVREALLRLEAQGLVEVRPRKGARIKPLTPADLAEIYDLLIEVESLAAMKAAGRKVAASDLSAMAQTIDDMKQALARDDREAWAEADDRFHLLLAEISGNARIIQITAMLVDQVYRARRVTLHLRPTPTSSVDDHAQLLEAIQRGDADAARSIQRQHRLTAKTLLLDLLERHRLTHI